MKHPMSLTEITKALNDGGLLSTAKDLTGTVSATLTRIKRTDGDLVQVQGKWGLSEWYPGMRKDKVEAAAQGKKGRKRGRPKGSKAKATASPKAAAARPATSKPTPEQIEQIGKLNAAGKKPGEIAKVVGLHHFTVMAVLKSKKAA